MHCIQRLAFLISPSLDKAWRRVWPAKLDSGQWVLGIGISAAPVAATQLAQLIAQLDAKHHCIIYGCLLFIRQLTDQASMLALQRGVS